MSLRYIDLFAGIGGFHEACSNKNGFECVFASEIEPTLQDLYEKNFGIRPHGDIRKIRAQDIPSHDLICAGFPCQPFSLAGSKKGAECPEAGLLIDHVVRIASHHKPAFVILENVPNVLTIAGGSFWEHIKSSFESLGYGVSHKIYSPVDFGIPQNRRRLFVLCSLNGCPDDLWPESNLTEPTPLTAFLNKEKVDKVLEPAKARQLEHWQELVGYLGNNGKRFRTLVAPEFGATYPANYKNITLEEMRTFRGAYGQDLSLCESWDEIALRLPSYARKGHRQSPWISEECFKSRYIYQNHRRFIDQWIDGLDKRNNSWQVLEWRCGNGTANIAEHLVQFRASGIRVIKKTLAPSLISMTPTQIPIVAAENRYMSVHEAAKLQNLEGLSHFPDLVANAFKALGNAVNARIVELITTNMPAAG